MEIRAVEGSKAAMRDFIHVPHRIYADNPYWVAPLSLERRFHFSSKNPYVHGATCRFFVAGDQGRPAGRISAQISEAAQSLPGEQIGHFGCLEATTPEVMHGLLAEAEHWLAGQGVTRIQGPYSLSINDEVGVLVDGFDSRPRMLMNYAQPWYGQALEEAGYDKAKDVLAYLKDMETPPPERLQKMAKRALARGDIRERPMDMRRVDAEIRLLMNIFNDAWTDNWGFVPMSEQEVAYMASAMRPLLHRELVRIIELDGEPVAMVVALPDLNEALKGLDGRVWPTSWAKLLWRLKLHPRPNSARLLLMGVRKRLQNQPLSTYAMALLFVRLEEAAKAMGIADMEMSWILEDNDPIIHMITFAGARPYKRYRIYEKAL